MAGWNVGLHANKAGPILTLHGDSSLRRDLVPLTNHLNARIAATSSFDNHCLNDGIPACV